MYLEALARLDAAGFVQYEISNVAKPGYRSRHNVKYWQGGTWRGFGCGAHSTVRERRWKNLAATTEYIDRVQSGRPVVGDAQVLTEVARQEEALFTGLRLADGIDERNFFGRFGVDPWSRYQAALQPFVTDGLMWRRDATFGLTRRGMLVANDILVTFV
jgi:oxygen-independent coproporphyrinogen-3 oxidase